LRSYGFHGEIGPPLDGVTDRYTEGEIRLIVVSAKKAFPDAYTIMPSFHKKEGYNRVIKDCQGYAMMSAQQIEDVVAYLMTIK
ncbi:MAG TPA: c-type cytochrome, partial [Rhizobiales bacterium]|nr:c-type cytochrome [Hyphomicrobiales bacterium]